jgi:hypothetical protein
MARISTYPLDTAIVGTDKWIGSDSQQLFATKNFTANAVAEFINGYNKIESTSLQYLYLDYDPTVGYQEGTISFFGTQGSDVLFSNVTTFMISKFQLNRYTDSLVNFYSSPLIGSVVFICQADKISNWGAFKWNQVAQNPTFPEMYDISLQYVSGPGSFIDEKRYLLSILTYDVSASNDKNFVFTQSTPSNSWVVTHNLNKYVAVSVVDSNDVEVYCSVDYDSLNTVTLTFSTPFSGKAFFN